MQRLRRGGMPSVTGDVESRPAPTASGMSGADLLRSLGRVAKAMISARYRRRLESGTENRLSTVSATNSASDRPAGDRRTKFLHRLWHIRGVARGYLLLRSSSPGVGAFSEPRDV